MSGEPSEPADVLELARAAASEIAAVVDAVDGASAAAAVNEIVAADAVLLTGMGRSGLVARAWAMRLMHIGLRAFAVGEVATPAIGAGDVLIAVSARGSGSIAAQAKKAADAGARILAVTATGSSDLARTASVVVVLPARTGVPSNQHAGSLFEQASLVIADAVCAAVRMRLGVPEAELDRRHANLL